jgi:hypothetical protein
LPQQQLSEWRIKEGNIYYMSSIMLRNENIPDFETIYNQVDYDWLLKVTEGKKCVNIPACVLRYVNGKNLSLNEEYRVRALGITLSTCGKDLSTVQRVFGTHARYYYKVLNGEKARFWFKKTKWNFKIVTYYLTSYSITCMKFINKHWQVF